MLAVGRSVPPPATAYAAPSPAHVLPRARSPCWAPLASGPPAAAAAAAPAPTSSFPLAAPPWPANPGSWRACCIPPGGPATGPLPGPASAPDAAGSVGESGWVDSLARRAAAAWPGPPRQLWPCAVRSASPSLSEAPSAPAPAGASPRCERAPGGGIGKAAAAAARARVAGRCSPPASGPSSSCRLARLPQRHTP